MHSAEEEEDTELKARLWKKADATFAKAISVVSNTRAIDMQWAGLLYELAKNEGGHGATGYLTKADKKYEMLAAFAPDAEIFANWGNLHLLWAEHRAFSSWSAASKQVRFWLYLSLMFSSPSSGLTEPILHSVSFKAHYNTCIEKWEMAIKLSSMALNSIYLTTFKPGQGSVSRIEHLLLLLPRQGVANPPSCADPRRSAQCHRKQQHTDREFKIFHLHT